MIRNLKQAEKLNLQMMIWLLGKFGWRGKHDLVGEQSNMIGMIDRRDKHVRLGSI